MKITVLDAGTLGADIDLTPLERLGELSVFESTPAELVAQRIGDAEVLVVNKVKLNGGNLSAAPKLKLICETATGYDNIDTAFCAAHGIAVCNVPGYSTHSVAQLTLAMVLSLSTHLGLYRQFVHSGDYTRSGVANRLTPVWHELHGQVWGVVGGGNIARQVARVAEAMGCRVLVCRRKLDPYFKTVDIDTLCRESDIISIHTPLTDETRGMVSRARIAAMKKNVILVNTARGAVTDEEALAEAVERGTIGGLGVDVYSVEPFGPAHPYQRILDRPNVCLTPHVAWGAVEARNRCIEEAAKNAAAFWKGETRNRVV